MTTHQSTFQNDNILVNLKKEPGCKILLEVTVAPKATEASYHKAVGVIRKDISIPGFRKGKAPEAMILQKYEKFIEKEWKDILLNTSLDEAIKLIKIVPYNRNSVKSASIKSASLQEGSSLSFEYEAAPDVPSISPETLSLPPVKLHSVTQKDVDEAIEDLSLQSAEWSDVTDRPAKEGDFVLIDIDDIGESAKNICTNTLFSIKKGKMGEWMRRLLVGMTSGQTAEAMSEKDEHDADCKACEEGVHPHHHDENFIPTLCRITLHTIREAKPHPINDDLAKKYGAGNAQELTERVKASLEKRASDEAINKKRNLIEQELLARYPFDIPDSLVQEELKNMKKSIIDGLRTDGVEESMISAESKKIEAELAKKYVRDYRFFFLTQKFARDQNIQVGQDEISMERMRQMWMEQMGQKAKNDSMDEKDRISQIQFELLAIKTLDHIIHQVENVAK